MAIELDRAIFAVANGDVGKRGRVIEPWSCQSWYIGPKSLTALVRGRKLVLTPRTYTNSRVCALPQG